MGVSNLNRWTNKLIFLKSTQHPIIWRQPMYKGRCWIINNESCSGVGGLLVLLVGTIPHAKLITSESSASAETDKSCKIKWFGRLWPTVTSATIIMNSSYENWSHNFNVLITQDHIHVESRRRIIDQNQVCMNPGKLE